MMPELFHLPFLDWPIKGYGFMLMIGFLSAIWIGARRAVRVKADPDMVINFGFIMLLLGVAGARIFYVAHYWNTRFAHTNNPILAVIDLTSGGLEFYGGFIGAGLGVVVYLWWKGASLRLYSDIVAPGLMWGLAFGRLGCFLNGCCWGGMCAHPDGEKSFAWAMTFPYGSGAMLDQWQNCQKALPADLIYVKPIGDAFPIPRDRFDTTLEAIHQKRKSLDEKIVKASAAVEDARKDGADTKKIERLDRRLKRAREAKSEYEGWLAPLTQNADLDGVGNGKPTYDELKKQAQTIGRSLPVHPTQLYSAINAFLLSFALSAVFRYRKRQGIVFPILLLCYAPARMILEQIRVDNPLDTFGLTISSGVSVAAITIGIIWLLVVMRLPLRSPLAEHPRYLANAPAVPA